MNENPSLPPVQTPMDAPVDIRSNAASDPFRRHAEACFGNTRIPIYDMLDWLADGGSFDDYLANFTVDPDAARTVILTAGHHLSRSVRKHLTVSLHKPPVHSATTR